MNKKGILLAEETLKIVLALISVSFLIYFLSALYFSNQNNKDLELAEASLQHLIDEVNSGSSEIEIYNPKGWIISSWPHDVSKSRFFYEDVIKNDIPNSCTNLGWQSCLCICDDAVNFEGRDCDDMGICMESNLRVQGNEMEIENSPLNLLIENGVISKK